jgi:DnaB-like helicase N terminal domain/AAA domain
MTDTLMPSNVEAEMAVLGSILIDPAALRTAADWLTPEDFYRDAHQTIYRAALDLHAADTPVDLIVLTDELERREQVDAIGGKSYVSSLVQIVPNSGNVAQYCQIVLRCATARRLIAASARLTEDAYNQRDGLALHAADLVRQATERDGCHAGGGRFQADDWTDIRDREKPAPLVEGLLALNTVGMSYGPFGCGKTTLHDHLALCVAIGLDWFGHTVTPGHVWIVQAEGEAYVREHFLALLAYYELDDWPGTLHTITADVPDLLRAGEAALLARRIREQTPPHERITLVRLDTLAATAPGMREDNTDMGAYVAAMHVVRRALDHTGHGAGGPHVHTVHHPGWGGDHSRGGYNLPATLDTVWRIDATPGSTRVVTCEKQRGRWAKFAPFGYRVDAVPIDGDGATGPLAVPQDLPSDRARAEARGQMPRSVADVWAVYVRLWRDHADYHEHGLYYGTWKQAADAEGIKDGTFKAGKKWLLDHGTVTQPDTASGFFPVESMGD